MSRLIESDTNKDTLSSSSSHSDGEEEFLVVVIGRIVRELCLESENEHIHKKLLQGEDSIVIIAMNSLTIAWTDGVMNMLLRLSKVEVPEVKLDVSAAILALTCGRSSYHDNATMKVLKWDAIDVLFWLTIHDCLALNDFIK